MKISKADFTKVLLSSPQVRIGKYGITATLIAEVESLLKKRGLAKIRFLQWTGFDSMRSAANHLADKVSARVVDRRGHTIVLQK